MFDIIMRENGFRRISGGWVRQNLAAHGLVTMEIRPMGAGQYDITLTAGRDRRASLTRGQITTVSIMRQFLTS